MIEFLLFFFVQLFLLIHHYHLHDDNVIELEDIIASTILVREVPPSVVNDIESPIFNSSVNLVLKPVTTVPLFATDNVPVSVALSPFVASNAVSAVNVMNLPLQFV